MKISKNIENTWTECRLDNFELCVLSLGYGHYKYDACHWLTATIFGVRFEICFDYGK